VVIGVPMTRKEKCLQDLLRFPPEAKWSETKSVIEHVGLVAEPPSTGSHWVVYHPQLPEIGQLTVPVHDNRIKRVYVRMLVSLVRRTLDAQDEGRDETDE